MNQRIKSPRELYESLNESEYYFDTEQKIPYRKGERLCPKDDIYKMIMPNGQVNEISPRKKFMKSISKEEFEQLSKDFEHTDKFVKDSLNEGMKLKDVVKIDWIGTEYRGFDDRLYRLSIWDKKGNEERIRSMKDLNDYFGTNFPKDTEFVEFETWAKKNLPTVKVDLNHIDVS